MRLSRIYTRKGDDGTTHLGDMSRTEKTDSRIAAFADVNEANAALGVALAEIDQQPDGLPAQAVAVLRQIQNDLFDVGADLCLPLAEEYKIPPLRVSDTWIDELEKNCDTFNAQLPAMDSFILPGGTRLAAGLHLTCTIIRRAERSVWKAIADHGTDVGGINRATAVYLNRLSDLVFILARLANTQEVTWVPGGGREEDPTRKQS